MTFDYLQRITVNAQLDVDNIGQCFILGRNDLGEEYYLITRTTLGFTEVITYGPVCPEIGILPVNVSMYYTRFEFSQRKIENLIDRFLNDGKKGITQAEVASFDSIEPHIKDSIAQILSSNTEDQLDE